MDARLEEIVTIAMKLPEREGGPAVGWRASARAMTPRYDPDALLGELKRISNEHTVSSAAGPVSIGPVDSVRSGRAIPEFAAHYYAAFSQGSRWYPYVEEREGKK